MTRRGISLKRNYSVNIKKELMYSLILPYLVIGLVSILLFVGIYLQNIKELKSNQLSLERYNITSLSKELDYIIEELQGIQVELEQHPLFSSLSSITAPMNAEDKYQIYKGTKQLGNILINNRLVSRIYLYYPDGEFILSGSHYFDLNTAYEKFHQPLSVNFNTWHNELITDYGFGKLTWIGGELAYVVSLPSSPKPFNLVITLDTIRLQEFISSYSKEYGTIYLVDLEGTQLFPPTLENSSINFSNVLNVDFSELGKTPLSTYFKYNKTTYFSIVGKLSKSNLACIAIYPSSVLSESIKLTRSGFIFAMILFVTLLLAGIFIIIKKYNAVNSLIIKLNFLNLLKDENQSYSEIDFMNLALDKIKETIKSQKVFVIETLLRRSLQGTLEDTDEIFNYLNSEEQIIGNSHFLIMTIHLLNISKETLESINLNEFIIKNILDECLDEPLKSHVVYLDDNYVCLINAGDTLTPEITGNISISLEKTRNFIQTHLSLNIACSVSDYYQGLQNSKLAYQTALKTLNYRIFFDIDEIIYTSHLEHLLSLTDYDRSSTLKLTNLVKLGYTEDATLLLDKIFNLYFTQDYTLESVRGGITEVYIELSNLSKDLKYVLTLTPNQLFKKYSTLTAIKNYLHSLITEMCQLVNTEQEQKTNPKMDRIIDYVYQNYQDYNLNVANIAHEFNMNASYLSRVFKEQQGENLLHFINKYRLEKAKILLVSTDLTLEQISNQVGFINSVAIIRTFKKYEGVTPTQYKLINK